MKRRFDGTYWVLSGPEVRDHPHAKFGWIYEHEWVLYARIGAGPHPCHWCGKSLKWHEGQRGIQVDHVDFDVHNNESENLVVACTYCNTTRRWTKEEIRARTLKFHDRPYQCKYCVRPFKNLSAVRGHTRWCKARPENDEGDDMARRCNAHHKLDCSMCERRVKFSSDDSSDLFVATDFSSNYDTSPSYCSDSSSDSSSSSSDSGSSSSCD